MYSLNFLFPLIFYLLDNTATLHRIFIPSKSDMVCNISFQKKKIFHVVVVSDRSQVEGNLQCCAIVVVWITQNFGHMTEIVSGWVGIYSR